MKACQKAIIRMATIAVPSYKSPFLCMLTLPKKFTGALLVYHLILSVNDPGHVYNVLYHVTHAIDTHHDFRLSCDFQNWFRWHWTSVLLALMCMSCVFTGVKTSIFVKRRYKNSISLLQWRVIIKQRVLPRCYCYAFIDLSIRPTTAHGSTGGEYITSQDVVAFQLKWCHQFYPRHMCLITTWYEHSSVFQHLYVHMVLFGLVITHSLHWWGNSWFSWGPTKSCVLYRLERVCKQYVVSLTLWHWRATIVALWSNLL